VVQTVVVVTGAVVGGVLRVAGAVIVVPDPPVGGVVVAGGAVTGMVTAGLVVLAM
jgi:hypothetical protein